MHRLDAPASGPDAGVDDIHTPDDGDVPDAAPRIGGGADAASQHDACDPAGPHAATHAFPLAAAPSAALVDASATTSAAFVDASASAPAPLVDTSASTPASAPLVDASAPASAAFAAASSDVAHAG